MSTPIFVEIATVKAQIAALRHAFPELEEDVEALSLSIESETDLHEIMTKLVRMEREAISFAVAIKTQEDALAWRRSRYSRKKEAYREMMQNLMEAAGQSSVRLPEASVSISKGRAAVIITDEDALPDQFVKIERTPRKADILAALLTGEDVPGAIKSNAKTILSIRV